MANINATPVLNRIYALLIAAGVQNVYRRGNTLPEPLPTTFIVLQPLFAPITRSGSKRLYATHSVQALCCSTGSGTAHSLTQTINEALPVAEFGVQGTSYENKSGAHYEVPVTITRIT